MVRSGAALDPVEHGGSGGNKNDHEAEPVARVQRDRQKHEQQTQIRRMTNDAVESGAIEGLRIEDGHIGTEEFAYGENGDQLACEDSSPDTDIGGGVFRQACSAELLHSSKYPQ